MNQSAPQPTLPMNYAQQKLALVWFLGAAIPGLILLLQSLLGKYSDSLQEVWGWFVPTVGPTLGLMIGTIGAGALSETAGSKMSERYVTRFFFRTALSLSAIYLLILTLTLLFEPFSPSPYKGIKLYNVANYWLAPVQSLVVAALSVLFGSQRKEDTDSASQVTGKSIAS
jgi:hypothetical protein